MALQKEKAKSNIFGWKDIQPSDSNSQRILKDRAAAFAKISSNETVTEKTSAYIKVRLGAHEYYGIPYHNTEEVREACHVSRVPGTPGFIYGIINIRGFVLTVFDLKFFFTT